MDISLLQSPYNAVNQQRPVFCKLAKVGPEKNNGFCKLAKVVFGSFYTVCSVFKCTFLTFFGFCSA